MDKIRLSVGLSLVAIIIAIGGYSFPEVKEFVGATGTRFPNGLSTNTTSPAVGQLLTTTLQVSSTGTSVAGLNHGTCYIAPYAATIAASTTVAVDCQGTALWSQNGTSALTGVALNDFVQVQLSTTTAAIAPHLGISLIGASASTTAGHIQLHISNGTGATFTWPTAGQATGTASFISTN